MLVSTGFVQPVVRYKSLFFVAFHNPVTYAKQENIEQVKEMLFCVKLNKSATEMFASFTDNFKDDTTSRSIILISTKFSKKL